jgi:hypothetical protein
MFRYLRQTTDYFSIRLHRKYEIIAYSLISNEEKRIMFPSGATCLPVDCCFQWASTIKYSNRACWSSKKIKQPSLSQSTGRHVAPLGNIILIRSSLLNVMCLVEKQHIPSYSLGRDRTHDLPQWSRGSYIHTTTDVASKKETLSDLGYKIWLNKIWIHNISVSP